MMSGDQGGLPAGEREDDGAREPQRTKGVESARRALQILLAFTTLGSFAR